MLRGNVFLYYTIDFAFRSWFYLYIPLVENYCSLFLSCPVLSSEEAPELYYQRSEGRSLIVTVFLYAI